MRVRVGTEAEGGVGVGAGVEVGVGVTTGLGSALNLPTPATPPDPLSVGAGPNAPWTRHRSQRGRRVGGATIRKRAI